DPLPDLGAGVRAATGGVARPLDQPPRRRGDSAARHGAGAAVLGRGGPLSLGHAMAEVGVREPRGRHGPGAAPPDPAPHEGQPPVTAWWAPGCLVGSTLSVAALLADPVG